VVRVSVKSAQYSCQTPRIQELDGTKNKGGGSKDHEALTDEIGRGGALVSVPARNIRERSQVAADQSVHDTGR